MRGLAIRVFSPNGEDITEAPYFSGNDLKRLRARKGLSQEWIAHHLGRSAKTISRWEKLGVAAIPDTACARTLHDLDEN